MANNSRKGKLQMSKNVLWVIILSFLLILLPFSFLVRYLIKNQTLDGGEWIIIVIVFMLFFYISLLESKFKYHINKLTYRLKHDIAKHDRKISIYSVIIAGVLIVVYEIMRLCGNYFTLFPLFLERKEYYAIVISICSLVVALLLSLKLDTKKIESGEDFLAALRLHAKVLQRKGTKEKKEVLHIYCPNINIGVTDITQQGKEHCAMHNIISENNHVLFKFHCLYYSETIIHTLENINTLNDLFDQSKNDTMLNYLSDYFKVDIHGNPDSLAKNCVKDLLEIIKFDNTEFQHDKDIKENMVGFRSRYEMVLGQYTDNENNRSYGKVDFNGEVVTIPEFIDFVPKIKKWN